MTTQLKSPFDAEFYAFVAGEMSAEAAEAYRKRLKADDELSSWVALVRGFVDGCLGPSEPAAESAVGSKLADNQLEAAVHTQTISNNAEETLDAESLHSLSQVLQRSDLPPVSQAWQRVAKIFSRAELKAYWGLVVDQQDLADVAICLGLTKVDVEIYAAQVARQLELELEPV